MIKTKKPGLIIGSMSLYFGWLLSFPLYGPVSAHMEAQAGNQPASVVFIFVLFQSLAYLAGGIFFKKLHHAQRLMAGGVGVALLMNLLLFLRLPQSYWLAVMAVMGIASSVFVLGWGKMFSMSMDLNQKQRAMALIIIISNIFYVLFNALAGIMDFRQLLLAGMILLLFSAALILYPKTSLVEEKVEEEARSWPKGLLAVFSLFFFVLNLNGGLMYSNMIPTINASFPEMEPFEFVAYILALVVLFAFTGRFKLERLVFLGTSLLGLSFLIFALFHDHIWGAVITAILTDTSFAMLDLFLWTTLGLLAFLYRMPYAFYGFVLSANVASILVGGAIGSRIAGMDNQSVVTAFFAAAAIFLTFAIMPWVQEHIGKDLSRLTSSQPEPKKPDGDKAAAVQEFLLPGMSLTPKELEILELIFSGMTNQEMADALFISINTLKTHLRHIYAKFGVRTKKELTDLAGRD